MNDVSIERALSGITRALRAKGLAFALVGGLAVSIRAEVRFTRDVDVVVAVADDEVAERLIYDLIGLGYRVFATVEHEARKRLATVRLISPEGVKVDLLFASSGIESEIAARATSLEMGAAGIVPVARAEEILAMKVLSMTERRFQDRIDAQRLVELVPELDVDDVRANLKLIQVRGYDRAQDLTAKLDAVLTGSIPRRALAQAPGVPEE
jgi:hypothetical protein